MLFDTNPWAMRGVSLLFVATASTACTPGDEVGATDGGASAIGPAGGEAVSADGLFRLIIPPGALTSEINLQISPTTNAPASLGIPYQVSPEMALSMDATAIYDWSTTSIGDRDPNKIVIARDIGAEWEELRRVNIDFDVRTVTCLDDRISFNYGIIISDNIPGTSDTDTETDGETDTETDTDGTSVTTDPPLTTTTSETTTGPDTDTDTDTDTTTTETGSTTTGSSSGTGSSSTAADTDDPPGECGNGNAEAGEVCLLEGITLQASAGPRGVAAGLVDGDGNIDLVVIGSVAEQVEVRRGNGNGLFLAAAAFDTGANPAAVALADIDGGGDVDIIVTNEDDNSVGVLSGNGDGTFADIVEFATTETGPTRFAIGDIDGAMGLDVLAVNDMATASVMLNDGAGILSAGTSATLLGAAVDIGIDDFTGEGNLDVVAASGSDVLLAAGGGNGLFGPASDFAAGAAISALVVDDFNGDGDPDVAVSTTSGLVTVFLGDGSGGFGLAVPYPTGAGPVALAAADLDGDGEVDLATVDNADETVSVLVGDGNGGFAAPITYTVGANPVAFAIADYNSDSQLDIVVANFDDDDTSLLLSSP